MNTWKRITALLLTAACMTVLTACGNSPTQPETETPQPAATAAEPAEKPFVPTSMRYVSAPEEAFEGTESGSVIAVGEGGGKLLICGRNAIYLWDTGAGKRIPVFFSREEDCLLLETKTALQISEKSTVEYLKMKQQKIDEYKKTRGIEHFDSFDQIADMNGGFAEKPLRGYCLSAGEHYADVMLVSYGLKFTVDLRSGEARMIVPEEYRGDWEDAPGRHFMPVLCGDLLLADGITDLNSGETVQPELALPEILPEGLSCVTRPSVNLLLPDGSVLELRQALINRRKKGEEPVRKREWYLIDRRADRALLTLLSEDLKAEYGTLLVTENGKYAAVFSRSNMYQDLLIVNRETGELRTREPGIYLIGAYDEGFIGCDLNSDTFVRLDAETLAVTPLSVTGDECQELKPLFMTSFIGHGRVYCSVTPGIQGWFEAE